MFAHVFEELKPVIAGLPISKEAKAQIELFSDTCNKGFEIEASFTSDDPKELRNRSLKNAMGLFMISEAIEGYERAAMKTIQKSEDKTQLSKAITQNTKLRKKCEEFINQIVKGDQ